MEVGTPAQRIPVQLDTNARDIVVSLNYDTNDQEFEGQNLNFDPYESSTWTLYSTPWGSDSLQFEGSTLTYTSVLFGERESSSTPSVFGLGEPHEYSDGLQSIWQVLEQKNISRSFSIGLSSAPQDFVGDEDTLSQSGWLGLGYVARAYYDTLSTVPMIEGQGVAFTVSAIGTISSGSTNVNTASDAMFIAQIQTLPQFPSMPQSLVEYLATSFSTLPLEIDSSGFYIVDCDLLSDLMFNFQGQVIRIPSSEVIMDNGDGTCSLAITPTSSNDTLTLSGGLLSYIYFVVDYDNSEISLGQAKLPGDAADPDFQPVTDGDVPGATKAKYYEEVWTPSIISISTSRGPIPSASMTSSTFSSPSVTGSTSTHSSSSSSQVTPYTSTSTSTQQDITMAGDFIMGELRWKISVPVSLGPWTSVDFETSGEGYDLCTVSVNGVDVTTDAYLNGASLGYTYYQNASSEQLEIVYTGGRKTSNTLLSSNVRLFLTRPDKKRDSLIFELSYTIEVNGGMSISAPVVTSTVAKSVFATTMAIVTSFHIEACSMSSSSVSVVTPSSGQLGWSGSRSDSTAIQMQSTTPSTVAPSIMNFTGGGVGSYGPSALLLIPLVLLL